MAKFRIYAQLIELRAYNVGVENKRKENLEPCYALQKYV